MRKLKRQLVKPKPFAALLRAEVARAEEEVRAKLRSRMGVQARKYVRDAWHDEMWNLAVVAVHKQIAQGGLAQEISEAVSAQLTNEVVIRAAREVMENLEQYRWRIDALIERGVETIIARRLDETNGAATP